MYDSPYAKAHPGAPHKGEALLLQNLIAAPVNLNGLEIQAPLSSQTYTPASTLTIPSGGRFALIHGDETNSTEKTAILAALGFSAADLADTSLVIVWQQSLSLDPAGETLRLTYKKIPADPETLVDELSYGNALGGADSLSARLADTLWQYAAPPALSRGMPLAQRLSHSGAGNTFRSSSFGTRGFRGGGIQIPFLPGARPVYAQHVRGKRLYELKNHLGNPDSTIPPTVHRDEACDDGCLG